MGIISKTHQSSLSINGGIFSKITPSLFTIKEGSTAFPKPPFPSGDRGCVNRPTRCSNRFAIRLADHQRSSPAAKLRFAVCDRMDTNCLGAAKAQKPIAARPEGQKNSQKQQALKGQKLLTARPEGQ